MIATHLSETLSAWSHSLPVPLPPFSAPARSVFPSPFPLLHVYESNKNYKTINLLRKSIICNDCVVYQFFIREIILMFSHHPHPRYVPISTLEEFHLSEIHGVFKTDANHMQRTALWSHAIIKDFPPQSQLLQSC